MRNTQHDLKHDFEPTTFELRGAATLRSIQHLSAAVEDAHRESFNSNVRPPTKACEATCFKHPRPDVGGTSSGLPVDFGAIGRARASRHGPISETTHSPILTPKPSRPKSSRPRPSLPMRRAFRTGAAQRRGLARRALLRPQRQNKPGGQQGESEERAHGQSPGAPEERMAGHVPVRGNVPAKGVRPEETRGECKLVEDRSASRRMTSAGAVLCARTL